MSIDAFRTLVLENTIDSQEKKQWIIAQINIDFSIDAQMPRLK